MKKLALRGIKILVVDDEADLRDAIVFDLKRQGCEVFEASSGFEAIEKWRTHSPDCIVSDVRMPNGSGIDLLKEIRSQNPDIPVVFLATGFADLSEEAAIKLGARALIQKPFNRKEMLGLIISYFEGINSEQSDAI